jgi:hypothetical protein
MALIWTMTFGSWIATAWVLIAMYLLRWHVHMPVSLIFVDVLCGAIAAAVTIEWWRVRR